MRSFVRIISYLCTFVVVISDLSIELCAFTTDWFAANLHVCPCFFIFIWSLFVYLNFYSVVPRRLYTVRYIWRIRRYQMRIFRQFVSVFTLILYVQLLRSCIHFSFIHLSHIVSIQVFVLFYFYFLLFQIYRRLVVMPQWKPPPPLPPGQGKIMHNVVIYFICLFYVMFVIRMSTRR